MASLTSFLRSSKSNLSVKSGRSGKSNLSSKSNLSNISGDVCSLGALGSDSYLLSLHDTLITECFDLTNSNDWNHATVLDVGCGKGNTTRQLMDRMPHLWNIMGIDNDEAAVDHAFHVYADESLDFAVVNLEDSNSFELKWGGRFDWLFSGHALLWAKDHASALRNLMFCLRPGGRCFVAVPATKPKDLNAATAVLNSSTWKKTFQAVPEVVSDLTDANFNRLWFHHPHADRVYSALWEQVGYEVLKTKLLDFSYVFASNDEYKECLLNLLDKAIGVVPEAKRTALVKDLLKAAKKKAQKTKDGKIIWTITYALLIARRPEL